MRIWISVILSELKRYVPMLAVFIQSQLLGGTGICHFLVVFAGLDEIQQMTFIQISSFGLLLNNKISLSVFKMHSISLVTEVNRSRNPLYFSFCTEHTWVNVGKVYWATAYFAVCPIFCTNKRSSHFSVRQHWRCHLSLKCTPSCCLAPFPQAGKLQWGERIEERKEQQSCCLKIVLRRLGPNDKYVLWLWLVFLLHCLE